MLALSDTGWAGWILPALLVAVWLGLWWVRRLAMVWFFAIALAVSVLSCPAGFVVELLFPSDCESNAVRVSRENLCFASHAIGTCQPFRGGWVRDSLSQSPVAC